MNPKLKAAFDFIVDSDRPSEMVELADAYIQMYKKGSRNFILHPEHQVLEEMVIQFSKDLKAYRKFVELVRDTGTAEQHKETQLVFRRINSRYTQIERRRRLQEALKIIESTLGIHFTFGQANAVEQWLELYWSKQRIDALDDARRTMSKNRVSTDERAEICDAFWDAVDQQLKNNISPIPSEVVYAKLASLESHKSFSV